MSETNNSPLEWMTDPQNIKMEEEPPVQYWCGKAGTGKTFMARARCQEDPAWGILTATTGIAAVNIGSITLNSTLRYFNTRTLRDAYLSGHLLRKLHEIGKHHQFLVIDEGSMLGAEALDILYRAVRRVNQYADMTRPMGIVLIADFAQLPPVNEPWAFTAACWPEFAGHTMILEKVWRQADVKFLEVLNAVRAGQGQQAADLLDKLGVKWHTQRDTEFDGTTIVPINEQVSRHNEVALDGSCKGPPIHVASRRWGEQLSEWGENPRTHEWGIPPKMTVKLGAYVMILANAQDFSMVNGDCGHIVQFSQEGFHVKLVRNGKVVLVRPIVRHVEQEDAPEGFDGPRLTRDEDAGGWINKPHFRGRVRKYVTGQVQYVPMRLAYASSVHKSQSLTLDRVQIDFRHWFFGKEAMLYVAMSRCRTLEGLRLVGQKEKFVTQCNVDPRVRPWL